MAIGTGGSLARAASTIAPGVAFGHAVAARSIFDELMRAVVAARTCAPSAAVRHAAMSWKTLLVEGTPHGPSGRGFPDRVDGRHRRLRAAGRSSLPGVLGPVDGMQLQRVKWTDRGLQAFGGDVEIAGGGADIGVAQEHLNGAQVGAGIQHMSGAGVAEEVRMHDEGDGGASCGIAAQGADGAVVERQVAALCGGQEPVGGFALSSNRP